MRGARSLPGTPEKMLPVFRQYDEYTRDCVRMDYTGASEWLAPTQLLRHGCDMSPLRFNVFIVVATHAVEVLFSQDLLYL